MDITQDVLCSSSINQSERRNVGRGNVSRRRIRRPSWLINANLDSDQAESDELGILKKIISGDHSGADRAALGFAIDHGISHGGWCPKGRKAEDGPLESRYLLTETPSSSYPQRTQ